MMLEHLGWNEAAERITAALESAFEQGYATADLAKDMPNGKPLSTTEFTDKVLTLL